MAVGSSILSPEQFAQSRWAMDVGAAVPSSVDHLGSLDEMFAAFTLDPEAFLRSPYASPYESWCVEDHQTAARLPPELQPSAAALAREAYLAAWKFVPNPEVCGLFSDDVLTIYSLLLMRSELSRFTAERASWITVGRIPWGYTGSFPGGRWLVL
jgi:hypothetical protein